MLNPATLELRMATSVTAEMRFSQITLKQLQTNVTCTVTETRLKCKPSITYKNAALMLFADAAEFPL